MVTSKLQAVAQSTLKIKLSENFVIIEHFPLSNFLRQLGIHAERTLVYVEKQMNYRNQL